MKSKTCIFSPLIIFLLLLMSGCNLPPLLATLEATIVDPNDTSGSGSSYAVVNFTDFFAVDGNNGGAELRFSNPEGDTLTIVIPEASNGSYTIGALTQVSGQITITRNLEQVTQAISASAGNISITGIATDGDEIIAAQGSFEVNLEGGGAATCRFDGRS